MEPNLQKKLLKYLVARDKNEFKNLFCMQLNSGRFSVVSDEIIADLFQHIELEIFTKEC